MFKWTYGLLGHNYRVATLSKKNIKYVLIILPIDVFVGGLQLAPDKGLFENREPLDNL